MRPPFPYFGSKGGTADRIVALLPEHRHYVEPFAGSLAVLLAKPPTRYETVNDLSGELMTFWRVLRDRTEDLERICRATPHSRAEYEAAFDESDDDIERARRVWVKLTQSRSGLFRHTGWRHIQGPVGAGASMPTYLGTYADRIRPAADRLRNVSLECRDALDVIRDYGRHEGVLIYADPPYLAATRSDQGANYAHELRTEDEHRELFLALVNCTATVVLSGYHSPLYDEMYADWHRLEIPVRTGNGVTGDQSRVEVLWSNRALRNPSPSLFEVTA